MHLTTTPSPFLRNLSYIGVYYVDRSISELNGRALAREQRYSSYKVIPGMILYLSHYDSRADRCKIRKWCPSSSNHNRENVAFISQQSVKCLEVYWAYRTRYLRSTFAYVRLLFPMFHRSSERKSSNGWRYRGSSSGVRRPMPRDESRDSYHRRHAQGYEGLR